MQAFVELPPELKALLAIGITVVVTELLKILGTNEFIPIANQLLALLVVVLGSFGAYKVLLSKK